MVLIYIILHFRFTMDVLDQMRPNDVWSVRLFFCKGDDNREAFSVKGNLHRRFRFSNGETKDYVFHAENTAYPDYEEGFLVLEDDRLVFVKVVTRGFVSIRQEEFGEFVGEPCRVQVLSRRARGGMGSTGGSPDGNPQMYSNPTTSLRF